MSSVAQWGRNGEVVVHLLRGNDRYVVRYSLDVDQANGLRMSWQLRILPGRSKEAANRRNPLIPSIRRAGQ